LSLTSANHLQASGNRDHQPPGHRRGAGRGWLIALLAISAFVLTLTVLWITQRPGAIEVVLADESPISRDLARGFVEMHDRCRQLPRHGASRGSIELGPDGSAPADSQTRPSSRPASLAGTPFLPETGYELVGFRRCGYPDQWTSHVLYANPFSGQFASLFIQAQSGSRSLEEGRLLPVTAPGSSPVVLVWRVKGRDVFLVADDAKAARRIAETALQVLSEL
jgi:hypothetical protein